MNILPKFNRNDARILGCWLLLGLLSGCGAPLTPGPTPASGEIVVLWHGFTDARQEALLALGDRFNAERPAGITLVIEYHADLPALLPTTSPDQRPDLVIAMADEVPAYAAQGLTALAPADIPADLLPMGRALFTVKGTLQALPLGLATYVLYTNDNWLRDIGYTPATAILEDLRLSTCRATDLASGQVGLGLPSQPGVLLALLAAGEASLIGEDGYYHFDDPAGARLGTIVKEGLRAACIRTFALPAEGITQFGDSAMAMLIESSLNRREIQAAVAAESNFTLGVTRLPGPTGPGATLWYGVGIFATQTAKPQHPAAGVVLDWLLQPEAQALWTAKTHYLPVRANGIAAQLAALPAEAGIERALLELTQEVAANGAWTVWPAQAYGATCRAALVQALTALNTELPAHEALQEAVDSCNRELAP